MRDKYFEFTGTISTIMCHDKEYFFIIEGEDGKNRLFQVIGRELGRQLSEESDIERHDRYDLEMDTNLVFTVNEFGQYIVSYRWKFMRQMSELIRYVVDQARISDCENGGYQKAIVWMQQLQPLVNFTIDDAVIDEVEKALEAHPDIVILERNGGWFTFTAKFF